MSGGGSCQVAYQIMIYGKERAFGLPRFSLAEDGSVLEYPSIYMYKGEKHDCGDLWRADFPSKDMVSRVHSSTDNFAKSVFSRFKERFRVLVNELDEAADVVIEERLLISTAGHICTGFKETKALIPLKQSKIQRVKLLQGHVADTLGKLKEVNRLLVE
jgi:hypothetical protein